ncbi:MAG: ArsR family transcriptional regulator [Candidatus Lokiarchaeota archaeon]|nr:ArsR family transcriptional regulator [Candidatus Lokiarchaeota archaeon]
MYGEKNKAQLADLIKGKRKFQIYTYLEIYGKLSLTEISEKLNKTKSTIFEHLKFLNEIGLVNIEKRTVPTIPPTKDPKVKENVYSINEKFQLSFENLVPGLKLNKKLNDEQIKMLVDFLIFLTKMQISNLNIQKQVFEKIQKKMVENPNQIRERIGDLLRQRKIDENYLYTFTDYMHLSIPQFEYIIQKTKDLNLMENNKEFIKLARKENPIVLMSTAMPIKTYIEFLNEKD